MRHPRRKVAITVVVALVASGAFVGTSAAASTNQVLPGVTVGGIPVSGLGVSALLSTVSTAARAVETRPLTLAVGEREWKIVPKSFGITVDVRRTATRALLAGRSGPLNWFLHSLRLKKSDLHLVAKVDQRLFSSSLRNLAQQVNIQASNGEVHLSGSTVNIKAPSEGVELVMASARRRILGAALKPRSSRLTVPVTLTAPEVGSEQVAAVERQAKGVLAGPAEFSFQSRSITLSPDKIAAALQVKLLEAKGPDSLFLQADPEELKRQILGVDPSLEKPAKDASFQTDGESVSLIPSSDGTSIDTLIAAEQVVRLTDSSRPVIELAPKVLLPELTTEVARSLGIVKKIAGFTTAFDPRNAPRVANIDRMASAIDGKVLRPGDSFSLNGATGPRTPENGYQEAQVIVDGELVPGIGGGVCQVATTLFNAVFNAGLDIEQRSNHSLYISKYPIGRDAMVNYPVQDLKFRNDTAFGMLLRAAVTKKALTVNVYSSDLGRTVESSQSERRNPKPPAVKYIDDASLPSGQEVVVEEGADGFDITVTRLVKKGEEVLHRDTFVSNYRAWKRVIRRGTGPQSSSSPTPTSTSTGG